MYGGGVSKGCSTVSSVADDRLDSGCAVHPEIYTLKVADMLVEGLGVGKDAASWRRREVHDRVEAVMTVVDAEQRVSHGVVGKSPPV
jgi:hypothetical protein